MSSIIARASKRLDQAAAGHKVLPPSSVKEETGSMSIETRNRKALKVLSRDWHLFSAQDIPKDDQKAMCFTRSLEANSVRVVIKEDERNTGNSIFSCRGDIQFQSEFGRFDQRTGRQRSLESVVLQKITNELMKNIQTQTRQKQRWRLKVVDFQCCVLQSSGKQCLVITLGGCIPDSIIKHSIAQAMSDFAGQAYLLPQSFGVYRGMAIRYEKSKLLVKKDVLPKTKLLMDDAGSSEGSEDSRQSPSSDDDDMSEGQEDQDKQEAQPVPEDHPPTTSFYSPETQAIPRDILFPEMGENEENEAMIVWQDFKNMGGFYAPLLVEAFAKGTNSPDDTPLWVGVSAGLVQLLSQYALLPDGREIHLILILFVKTALVWDQSSTFTHCADQSFRGFLGCRRIVKSLTLFAAMVTQYLQRQQVATELKIAWTQVYDILSSRLSEGELGWCQGRLGSGDPESGQYGTIAQTGPRQEDQYQTGPSGH